MSGKRWGSYTVFKVEEEVFQKKRGGIRRIQRIPLY